MTSAKKILILEDEKEIAQLYAKFLATKSYECVTASNGIEGLDKLKKFTPDLILLDLNMPQMGGVEFYQNICPSGGKPRFPILVLTGRADMESLFKDFNVAGFIVKPFGSQRLLAEVDVILEKEPHITSVSLHGKSKSIVIIDENADALEKITSTFSRAGYSVETATNGVTGVEKIMAHPPELALVNLSLTDIPGDLLIFRLQEMAKTKTVKCILYVEGKGGHHPEVMHTISTKTGVKLLCEYQNPNELLEAVTKMLKQSSYDE